MPPSVAIVGPGALGMLIGARLSQVGIRVILVDRNIERADFLQREGLYIEEPDPDSGGSRMTHCEVTATTRLDEHEVDLAILTVKAYDTASALAQHRRGLMQARVILSLQNGLGNGEQVAELVGGARTLVGVTNVGARALRWGQVQATGMGETWIGGALGGPNLAAATAAEWFRLAGFTLTQATEDVAPYLWTKLAINVAINGFTALLGVENGALAHLPALADFRRRAVQEVVDVARACGVKLDEEATWARAERVVARTARNRSSMLADIEAARPTEVEQIYGVVVKLGRRLDIRTPVCEMVSAFVQARGQARLAAQLPPPPTTRSNPVMKPL